jgi:hypothetical protein
MNFKDLIVVHDTNTIERAMKILTDKKAILPNSETKEDNDWGSTNEICLAAYDYEEIIYHYRMWGHIRFIIKEEWINKNVPNIEHHQYGVSGYNEILIWKEFIRRHGFKKYSGTMRTAVNQLICKIPVPLSAIECIIIYKSNLHNQLQFERELQLLKDNKPSNIQLFIIENNALKLIV